MMKEKHKVKINMQRKNDYRMRRKLNVLDIKMMGYVSIMLNVTACLTCLDVGSHGLRWWTLIHSQLCHLVDRLVGTPSELPEELAVPALKRSHRSSHLDYVTVQSSDQ